VAAKAADCDENKALSPFTAAPCGDAASPATAAPAPAGGRH
jgi:hypothetical protein